MWFVKWRPVECCFCPIIKPVEVLQNCLVFCGNGKRRSNSVQVYCLITIRWFRWRYYSIGVLLPEQCSCFSCQILRESNLILSHFRLHICHIFACNSYWISHCITGTFRSFKWFSVNRDSSQNINKTPFIVDRQVKRIRHRKRCSLWIWFQIRRRYERLRLKCHPCMTYANDVANRNL